MVGEVKEEKRRTEEKVRKRKIRRKKTKPKHQCVAVVSQIPYTAYNQQYFKMFKFVKKKNKTKQNKNKNKTHTHTHNKTKTKTTPLTPCFLRPPQLYKEREREKAALILSFS